MPSGEPTARRLARCYAAVVPAGGGAPIWTAPTRLALLEAADWMDRPRPAGLAVTGPPGAGKTTLLRAVEMLLAPDLAAAGGGADGFGRSQPGGITVVYRSARDLYADPGFNPDDPGWMDGSTYAACRDAALCVLDDIGQEETAHRRWGNEYRLVAGIILARYDRRRPLVLSSNLSMAQIGEKYGALVGDRLREMCRFVRIEQGSFRRAGEGGA